MPVLLSMARWSLLSATRWYILHCELFPILPVDTNSSTMIKILFKLHRWLTHLYNVPCSVWRHVVCDIPWHVQRARHHFTIESHGKLGVSYQIEWGISASETRRIALRSLVAQALPHCCIPQRTPAAFPNSSSQLKIMRIFILRNQADLPLYMFIHSVSLNTMHDMCETDSCTFREDQFHHRIGTYSQRDFMSHHANQTGERSTHGNIPLRGTKGCPKKRPSTHGYGRQYIVCSGECNFRRDGTVTSWSTK